MTKLDQVRELLHADAAEGVLIKTKHNKQYLGGLGGSGVYLLITPTQSFQILDGRYIQEANQLTTQYENIVVPQGSYLPRIIELLKELQIKNLAIESAGFSIQDYLFLTEQGLTIQLWTDELTTIRGIKTEAEIEKIRAACALTDEVFAEILPAIKVGMQENELGALIQYLSLKKGATGMAFDLIIASGPRSAMPHGRPTTRKFEQGDLITIDFGVVLDGYQSDMTRTVALGEPSAELRKVYDIVLAAQLAGIDAIKAGATALDVDQAARSIIEAADYGPYFSHGLGHGIGMGGDMPILNARSTTVLADHMVMSCEPGIYIADVGGVRIEDDVVIIDGIGVPLNQTTKELLIVGE